MFVIAKDKGARVLYVGTPPRHDIRFVVESYRTVSGAGVRFAILWSDAERGLTICIPWIR